MKRLISPALLFLAAVLPPGASAADSTALLNGAGATFPYPLYSKWFAEFRKVEPQAEINYQSVGSGAGIKALLDKTVDFGASDAPMTDEQLGKASSPVFHLPTVMGAVVVTYNLPELTEPLRLPPDVLADVFLGKITQWNDARIAKENPKAKLPETAILVARRSDGSGTSAIFTDYLSQVSPEWKEKVGAGTAVKWPVGVGGKGNEGVTGIIKQTPGAIGYVELIYAEQNSLPSATLKNRAGQYVRPSLKSVTAAAAAKLKALPADKRKGFDFRLSITDAEGKDSYPIAGFTYLLVYKAMPGEKGKLFTKFMGWALGEGQKIAEGMTYAPLPKELLAQVKGKVKEIEVAEAR